MSADKGRYPVHVVVGVALAPPLTGVAAVAAILRVLRRISAFDTALFFIIV